MTSCSVFLRAVVLIVAATGAASSAVAAPTVWAGPTISFAKPSGADFALPSNQDHLTSSVALTRASSQGIFNILDEGNFTIGSPAGTRWATALNNPSDTIAATNWGALDFTTWAAAYANNVGTNILNYNAVVHLLADDAYLDLRFTSFQGGGSGGGFAYERSTPVPEPTAALHFLAGLVPLLALKSCLPRTQLIP
jgi:hypothetical protein